MPTSYLANSDLQAYFLIFKYSKGYNPIAQHWALEKLFIGLQPYVLHLTNLLLGRSKPLNKTDKYIASRAIDKYRKDDLIQDINFCILYVLRKQKLNNTDRLYDYMRLVLRELFNGRRYSLNRASNES